MVSSEKSSKKVVGKLFYSFWEERKAINYPKLVTVQDGSSS